MKITFLGTAAATSFPLTFCRCKNCEDARIHKGKSIRKRSSLLIDDTILFIKEILKSKKMSVVNFLKAMPRKKRLDIVDILRGTLPIPIDYKNLSMIGQILELNPDEIYELWETRMKQVLEVNGMNIYANSELVNSMFDCAKKYISLKKSS